MIDTPDKFIVQSCMLEQLQKDNIEARKAKDTLRANLLGTVIAEAKMVGKNDGNRDPREDEIQNVIKKFLKGITESVEALKKSGRDIADALKEKEILESYLPKQLNEEDLKKVIDDFVGTLSEKSPKAMGQVMAHLKEKYPNQYDGKMASQLTKAALS